MTEFNATALIADVRTLAAENPDNKAICAYVTRVVNGKDDGTLRPECIMGHALVRAGADIEDLNTSTGIRLLVKRPNDYFDTNDTSMWTEDQLNWLSLVQGRQDTGGTWAEAIKHADERVPL